MKLTATKAIREFCRQCMPEPKAEYLRCRTVDCPLWRFRTGNPNRAGAKGSSAAQYASRSPINPHSFASHAAARVKVAKVEAEVKETGKTQSSDVGFWPYGVLAYKAGERPLRAIKRHCADCMGSVPAIKDCCSPNCTLFNFRFGRRPKAARTT